MKKREKRENQSLLNSKRSTRAFNSNNPDFNLLCSKRSQITIFVIIALIIVAAIIIFFSVPRLRETLFPVSSGELFPKTCIEKVVRESLNKTMMHGGAVNPELYFMYKNTSLNYVCYTKEWYRVCVMQEPFLKESIEREIERDSASKINKCIEDMKASLEAKGYSVKITGDKKASIAIKPDSIEVSFNMSVVLEDNNGVQPLNSELLFTSFNSKSYEIIMIGSSIQNYEARYGDSIIDNFMGLYPNIRVDKLKQSDGTKVYIIADRNTGERLQFATRSLAWPPGLYVEELNK